MKIRVYPDNANEVTEVYAELEFDAVPRVGEFVCLPFSTEQQWAKKILSARDCCIMFSQWVSYWGTKGARLDFSDAMITKQIKWLYDNNENRMICYLALDADVKGCPNYSESCEIRDVSPEQFRIIRRNTVEEYEL